MRGTSGLLLIGIGLLHTVFGVMKGYGVLSRIARATFSSETAQKLVTALGRELVFWFLFGGFMMILLGHLFLWIERRLNHPVPAFLGWELLALSLLGLIVMPVSGFWIILAVAIYTIASARRTSAQEPQPAPSP